MARLKADNAEAAASGKPASKPATTRALEPPRESKPAHVHKESIIQQLLQNNSRPSSFQAPPPFFMCSESEALDRQSCLELSPFEYLRTTSTDSQTPLRNADATWDANEISLDFSPTPKKSSLAAALSTPPKSAYYSKVSNAYVPPSKRNANTVSTPAAAAATPSAKPNGTTTPMSTSRKASRPRPKFHPQLVIKKYRRSAAGGGVNEQSESVRTLDQLNGTVDYLMHLFAAQMPPNLSSGDNNWNDNEESEQRQFSLCDSVNFIDDRLRAVQKDLVTLVGDLEDSSCTTSNSLENGRTKVILRNMQAKMVRYNILALYLLSDVPADKYQVKFGTVALRTCLTSYMNLSRSLHEEYDNSTASSNDSLAKELKTQDEIMSYVALFHMSAVLRSEETALPPPSSSSASSSLLEESGSGWGAIFSTFSKHVASCNRRDAGLLDMYPRWKWSIDLASAVQSGNYQRYFNLLRSGPGYETGKTHVAHANAMGTSDNARFLILARCCCSSSLNLIRLAKVRRYNHSFGKGEKVPAHNMARLLHFDQIEQSNDASKNAVELCRDIGLPIVNDDPGKCYITMKAAPISISGDDSIKRICNPGRNNDLFVFELEFRDDVSLLVKRLKDINVDESIDDWEERDSNDIAANDDNSSKSTACRVDDDHVLIPSCVLLSRLID